MSDKNKLNEDLQHFEKVSAKDEELIHKLDEFVALLQKSTLDSENIKGIKSQLNDVLDQKLADEKIIREIQKVSMGSMEKLDQLDQLEKILKSNHLDSKQLSNNHIKEGLSRAAKLIIGFLFIALGMAMIIMPAPPYFEMFTIFYFSPDDGVTLMDLISLIVVATGTFIVLRSLLNVKNQ